jgi:hypothetical protein
MYIGQTVRKVEYRIHEHFNLEMLNRQPKKKSVKLFNAMKKHGVKNFLWGVIEFCYGQNQEALNNMEIHYIEKYNTIENGYNLREGGANGSLNEDTKKKIGLAVKGRKATEEEKVHKSIATKKMWDGMDNKEKQRRLNKFKKTRFVPKVGSIRDSKIVEKIRISNTGKKRTGEALENIRIGTKNRKKWVMSEEEKLKRAERMRQYNYNRSAK